MKRYQAVFSALFLTGLFSLSALNLYRERAVLKAKFDDIARPKAASELKSYTRQLDGVLSQTLVGGHRWNELYGTVYRAIGKNEENSFKYVRDKDSVLYAGNFYNTSNLSAPGIAGRMRRLQDRGPSSWSLCIRPSIARIGLGATTASHTITLMPTEMRCFAT